MRLLEQHNPDVAFDWPRLIKAGADTGSTGSSGSSGSTGSPGSWFWVLGFSGSQVLVRSSCDPTSPAVLADLRTFRDTDRIS
jgi:hypothetical protein